MDFEFRSKVAEYFRSLADEDLARFFYEVMRARNEYRRHEEGDFWNDVYVIGITSHMSGEPAETYILAAAVNPAQPGLDDVKHLGANNSGRCNTCKTLILTTSKIARCPVCESEVECT